MYFEYSSALAIIGQEFSIISIFIIISFMGAALLFPIPAAIGSQEAGQVSAFAITKMKSSLGFSLSLLIRVRDLIWVFIGLFILFYYGLNSRTILKKVFKKSLTAKRVKIKKGVDVYIKNN